MAFFKGRFSAWLTVCGLVVASALAAFAADCNNNETQDSQDIGSGFSEDCNDNGVPDECEGFPSTSRSARSPCRPRRPREFLLPGISTGIRTPTSSSGVDAAARVR